MKFLPVFLLLFSFNLSKANDLAVEVNFGFCSSAGSGQAIVLATGGVEPYTFQWSDPSLEGEEVFDLNPGTYSLTVTDASACEIIETFEIPTFSNVLINYFVKDITCFGEMDGEIYIQNHFPQDLLFSLDGIDFSDQLVFENLDWGVTTIYMLESNGCISDEEIFVEEPEQLIVDLGGNIIVDLGEIVDLRPVVNALVSDLTYAWSATGPLSCTSCFEQAILPFEDMTVYFTVTNEDNCTASDEMRITVRTTNKLFIPNIFTPNNDGINDYFAVFGGAGVKRIKRLVIRNNFGGITFESLNFLPNNIEFGWDGTFNGKAMDNGVFLYQVTVEYIDDTVEDIFGTVTLFR